MDLRDTLFRLRGYTPIPFLVVSLIWARPDWSLQLCGVGLCLAGEMLRINSLRHAGGATRTRSVGAPTLVTGGPYGHVRNPLYLANMLLYTGFSLGSGALTPWLPIITFLFFAWQYGMIISLEETTLRKLFGDDYEAYCRKVPRLLPSVMPRYETKHPDLNLSQALREERSTLTGLIGSWVLLGMRLWYIRIIS